MPVAPKRAVGSSEPSAYERFHSTFQAAVTQELEALVGDLRSAAARVADLPVDLSDPPRGDVAEDASGSLKALVDELVARWGFVLATYRAHVAAEDEVVLPALAARVSNVAHAYELEHEAEDSLFDGITHALDEAVELIAANDGGGPAPTDAEGRERLQGAIQRAARTAHATKTALAQHLAKEAAHLVPLMDGAFAPDEQTALVERFIASVPAAWVGPVLARGPTQGEQGPLRTLIASWLARGENGLSDDDVSGKSEGDQPAAKRSRSGADAGVSDHGGTGGRNTITAVGPIDHIFQFHAALRRELRRLESDVLALPKPEETAKRAAALRTLEGRFVFFWGVYRAHSRSEDELVFPALENKDELHNVSHSYTLDHEHEAELFVEVDGCLRDLREHAGLAGDEGGVDGGKVHDAMEAKCSVGRMDPKTRAAIMEVERRLQAACVAVKVCLETHVAREEAELWPLFEKHFTSAEQGRLVGLIIGRTGAEVLQSMLSWQRKALTEEEKAAMIGSMRDASRNTRFASWLETWWSSEEGNTGNPEGGGDIQGSKGVAADDGRAQHDGRARHDAVVDAAAVDGLGQVQESLRRRADGDTGNTTGLGADGDTGNTTGVAKAAALAAAAAADKSGYTPSWDDMFRMNRQQLEQAARTLSRDDSLAPERKAYLMQHLLAARWICAQQRAKQLKKGEKGENVDTLDEAGSPGEKLAGADGAADAGVDGAAEKTGTAPPQDTAEAALALAGAPGLASYHKGASDDVVLCQPVGGEAVLGCKHYARKVRLVAACCGAAHVCRFCHDEAEDHTIDRYATKEMICMRCSARQPSAKECRECGGVVSRYFCSVCNFWDDSGNDVYHCPFCNVCRRGEGLGKDFFHCMQCNSCVSLTMGPHVCPAAKNAAGSAEGSNGGTVFAGSMESECPVCKDFLFYSDTPVKCLPCGHFMHTSCFQAYTKHYYTCPLCRKSLGDFSAYFRMLDAILAEEEEANATPGDDEEQAKRAKQRVACNDCGVESLAPFHFVYHACAECRSYNTRVLAVVPPSEVAKEEAKNDK